MSPVHRNLNTKPRSTSCDFVSPGGDENGERKREHADQGEREGERGYSGLLLATGAVYRRTMKGPY